MQANLNILDAITKTVAIFAGNTNFTLRQNQDVYLIIFSSTLPQFHPDQVDVWA